MDALTALATRHSTREFTARPVDRQTIEQIIDAGRLAPTARNVQPWEFIVVTEPAMRKRIADITEFGKFIAHSPACVAVFCKDTKYYLEDGCAATTNILNAAAALGVQSCWVAGDKKSYAGEIGALLKVPADHKLICLIALGYEPATPRRAPKRNLKDVLHWEQF